MRLNILAIALMAYAICGTKFNACSSELEISFQFVHGPNIPRTLDFVEGETIIGQLSFSGIKTDENMVFKLSTTFALYDSSGNTIKSNDLIQRGFAPVENPLLSAIHGFDSFGRLAHGKYILKIQTKDEIAGNLQEIKLPFEILPESVFRLKSISFVSSVVNQEDSVTAAFVKPVFFEGDTTAVFALVESKGGNNVIRVHMSLQIVDDTGKTISRRLNAEINNKGVKAGSLVIPFIVPPTGKYVAVVKGWNFITGDSVEYKLPFIVVPCPVPVQRVTAEPKTQGETPKPGQK